MYAMRTYFIHFLLTLYITSRMVQLTKEQRVFILLHYILPDFKIQLQNAFRARFRDRNPPHTTTILRNLAKYSNAGTSHNLNKICFIYELE